MKRRFALPGFVVGLVVCAGNPAVAGLSRATTPSPGGFIQTGAYSTTCGCVVDTGGDLAATLGSGEDFHEQGFAGISSAQQSASFSNGTISNTAFGSVQPGWIRMTATNASPDATFFPLGVANGGWKETFTVSHPTLNGQGGFMVFQIRARGAMHTTNLTGAASLQATAYKDNVQLLMNDLFDRGDSDPLSTGIQWVSWGLASYTTYPSSDNRTVDGTVTMAVPITFGQSFTLGIYAWASAGQRSAGGLGGSSSASLDFSGEGIQWAGIASVQSGGVTVSGYTIVSGTGHDWSLPLDTADPDGDGAMNSFDCAPLDPGAFAVPAEVGGAAFAANGQTLSWASSVPGSGSDTVHDVMRGALRQFPVGSGAAEICLASGIPAASLLDATVPAARSGFYYLVRGSNICGAGSYGFATGGAERNTSICP